MKNIKNILYITVLGLVGASCSDELQTSNSGIEGDFLTLNFEIPDEVVVQSRAVATNEGKLNNLGVYIFNSDGSKLLQYSAVNPSSGNTASVGLTAEAKGSAKLVYVVANAAGLNESPANRATLEALTVNAVNGVVPSGVNDYFVMSGTANVGANVSTTPVNLTRLAAKVTVEGNLSNYSLTGFQVHNAADKAFIGVPATNAFAENGTSTVVSASTGVDNPVYVYPSQSEGVSSADTKKTFVIVKAKNAQTNVESYYRLNLTGNGKDPLDLQPNHHVQVVITSIKGDGYPSVEEAAQNPDKGNNITATIHDHATGVYSMITDGTRELGSPDEILWSGSSASFTVKWFSHTAADMDVAPVVELVSGTDWLTLSTPNDDTVADPSATGDTPNTGKKVTYTLTLNGNAPAWDTEAEIKITWKGLERIVKVIYNAEFDPQTVFKSTTLSISGTSEGNYWSFLKEKLQGADKNAMGENKVRNDGFHFPMYYDGGKTYTYALEFKSDLFGDGITSVTAKVRGDAPLTTNVVWTPDNSDKTKGSLTFTNGNAESNKYVYATGEIDFNVNFTKGTEAKSAVVTVPVYHTGLFWNNTNTSYGNTGWYYYEVVPVIGSDKKTYYWLDRNIGATSCLNYVEASKPAGKEEAKGEQMAIGSYGSYSSPTINDEMCPKGFHVPTKTEFDKLRGSSNFVTEQENVEATDGNGTVSTYTTFFNSSNAKVGRVYFPKAKFWNNSIQAGDDASGYYWSRTESSGLEKDQIGHWVNALYMSGGSNTWINGDVEEHRMSIRAIAGDASSATETKKTISLNVVGATHVYIYDTTPGNGLFTFPGKAVCTAQAAEKNTKINFSYTTTSSTDNLMVYLVNVADDGTVTVYSENGKKSASKAEGIKYQQGYTYTANKNTFKTESSQN